MQLTDSFTMYAKAVHCSPLNISHVGNGNITYSTGTVEDQYEYETTATYTCDSGYELTGGDTVRTCTSSHGDQWNGTAPACSGNISFKAQYYFSMQQNSDTSLCIQLSAQILISPME